MITVLDNIVLSWHTYMYMYLGECMCVCVWRLRMDMGVAVTDSGTQALLDILDGDL